MKLRFAVPLKDDRPAADFHDCEAFAVIEVDNGRPLRTRIIPFPHADAQALVDAVSHIEADILIARGIRHDLLAQLNKTHANIITGADGHTAEKLVSDYLDGSLKRTFVVPMRR